MRAFLGSAVSNRVNWHDSWRRARETIDSSGFAFLPEWRGNVTTLELAKELGTPLDIPLLLPASGISTVQGLRPKRELDSPRNRYSAQFGLGEFPLHTDLAHWAKPPRYLVLRCIHGAISVATYLLHSAAVLRAIDPGDARRALVRARTSRNGAPCLLSLFLRSGDIRGFRWDPLFVVPVNSAAHKVAQTMSTHRWESDKIRLALTNAGDTLVIDNWRLLHGRASVSANAMARRIERVYLSELH